MSHSAGLTKAFTGTSTASKRLQGWRGCPSAKPEAQVLHQQPRTSLEDTACAYRLFFQPPASAGSRQEHGGKRLSRADSQTKPPGALWLCQS